MEYEFIDEMKSVLKRTDKEGGVSYIPADPANSDYQAYLNKDKAEQSTPMVTDEASTL